MTHTLIDLDSPQASSITEDNRQEKSASPSDSDADAELSSDFLEHLVVSENTVLYRAQVAVEENTLETAREIVEKKPRKLSDIRGTKVRDISVTRVEDEKKTDIQAILILRDTLIISDMNNMSLKSFAGNGDFLSSIQLEEEVYGLTRLSSDRFATCGYDDILLWKLHNRKIKPQDEKYPVELAAEALHFNGTYYCVLHREHNAITILDDRGRHVRKFVIKEAFGKNVKFSFDIHNDRDTHHVYMPCVGDNMGILCASVEGQVHNFFSTDWAPLGTSDICGFLCIVDNFNHCVVLSTKDNKSSLKLLDTSEVKSRPYFISVNESSDKVILSYYRSDLISVFSIQ